MSEAVGNIFGFTYLLKVSIRKLLSWFGDP